MLAMTGKKETKMETKQERLSPEEKLAVVTAMCEILKDAINSNNCEINENMVRSQLEKMFLLGKHMGAKEGYHSAVAVLSNSEAFNAFTPETNITDEA